MKMPPESSPAPCRRDIPRARASRVIFNRRVGPGWQLLRLEEPSIARASAPGQFVQIHCAETGSLDPLLRRPFSVYDVDTATGTYDVLYIVTGRGTRWMAALPEDGQTPGAGSVSANGVSLDVIGPFGNRFTLPGKDAVVVLVGGGVGVAPLHFLARELTASSDPAADGPNIIVCMGARTRSQLQGIEDLRRLPIRSLVATNDGSEGFHGFVTGLLEEVLDGELRHLPDRRVHVYGCGPTAMNESLRRVAVERDLECEICLESFMACGFGICFTCVVPVARKIGDEPSNRRICLEGPVFDARLIGAGLGVL